VLKNVLITGCSSGLGEALSQLYLDKGFSVWGISRTIPSFEHSNFTHISCDLSDIENIKPTLRSFLQKISSFEYVYLNAGILGKINTMVNLTTEDLMQTMNVNVYANKELLDLLFDIDTKVIVGISSGASVNGSKGWAAYSLSKSSLNMLLNLYAKEMPHSKLLAIAPGVIETPMTDIIRFDINDEDFPSAKVLKEGLIQLPKEAALKLYETVLRQKEFESGSFIDVRNI
jgi:alcohol dehydrogenase/benzil reductase ((S)-benzoin forming)